MGTLKEKNNILNAVITGMLGKIKFFECQLDKNPNDKVSFSKFVNFIDNDFSEIDKIVQENKSLFYRFVPLNKDLFEEVGKTKFRDQYHKLSNLIHSSNFAVECLRELSKDLFDNKDETLKVLSSVQKNIEDIGKLTQKINAVASQFIDPNKEIFEIISQLKEDNKIFKILVVDDVPGTLHFCKRLLEIQGFETFTASTVGEAIKNIKENCPDIVLLDLNLEATMDGIEVLRFIKDNKLSIKCIVNTVVDDEERLSIVNALKPDKILVKPFDNNQLLSQINAVIRGSK